MINFTDTIHGDFDVGETNIAFTAVVYVEPDDQHFEVRAADLCEAGRYTADGFRPHRNPVPLAPAFARTLKRRVRETCEIWLECEYPIENDW